MERHALRQDSYAAEVDPEGLTIYWPHSLQLDSKSNHVSSCLLHPVYQLPRAAILRHHRWGPYNYRDLLSHSPGG